MTVALKHLFGCLLFGTIAKPGMFVLGMTLKEGFFAYSTHIIFLIIRLVPGNVVMVTIDMSKFITMGLPVNMGKFCK